MATRAAQMEPGTAEHTSTHNGTSLQDRIDMTITAAGLVTGAVISNATSAVTPSISVTANQMIVCPVTSWNGSTSAPLVVGDISLNSGSATLGSWTLSDVQEINTTGTVQQVSGVYWCLCTGSGTLTVLLDNRPDGSYGGIGIEAFNGTWDSSARETGSVGSSTSTVTAIATNNSTSAGAALFVACTQVDADTTLTKDAAFTVIYEEGTNELSHIYRIVSSGTTDAGSWASSNAARHASSLTVFKEVAAGSTQAPRSMHFNRMRA